MIGLCVAMVGAACGSTGTQSAGSPVAGIYLFSSDDDLTAAALFREVMFAKGSEPADLTGFRTGISWFLRVSAGNGGIGARIAFTADRADALVDELVAEARNLDMVVQRVRAGEPWPDCLREPDCETAEFG